MANTAGMDNLNTLERLVALGLAVCIVYLGAGGPAWPH